MFTNEPKIQSNSEACSVCGTVMVPDAYMGFLRFSGESTYL